MSTVIKKPKKERKKRVHKGITQKDITTLKNMLLEATDIQERCKDTEHHKRAVRMTNAIRQLLIDGRMQDL